jgi:hypothetical protein
MAGRMDAQSTFGSLRGLTIDATGSTAPTAHITVHGLDDNTHHEVASGDDGVFEAENLKPGRYRVTGHKPGFADAVVPELTLEARQDSRVTLTFSVVSQTQTAEVSAVSEQISISTANVRQNGAVQDAYPSSEGVEELKVCFALDRKRWVRQLPGSSGGSKSRNGQRHFLSGQLRAREESQRRARRRPRRIYR